MSHRLFGSHTGSLIAHKSEQMKVKFWGCFFSLVFIFFPSSKALVIPTVCANTVKAACGISKHTLNHQRSVQLHWEICRTCGTGKESKFLPQLVGK